MLASPDFWKKETYPIIFFFMLYWIILVSVICNKIEFSRQKWYLYVVWKSGSGFLSIMHSAQFKIFQLNSSFLWGKMVECILWYWSIPLVFSKSSLDDLHQDEAKKQEKRKTTLITLYYSSYCHLVTKWEWKDKK